MNYCFQTSLPWLLGTLLILISCVAAPASPPTPTPPVLADELIFYDWVDDMPVSVLEAFTAEYGVKVTYLTYETQEEAIANMQAGQVYDVVVVGNDLLPGLSAANLLAALNRQNIPNFKNISPSFRDLLYDPGNQYSVPYTWGTTGIVVRSDLLTEPATRWADLWDPRYAGKIVLWGLPRFAISATLKALGYSANSENPAELEAALQHMLKLKVNVFFAKETDGSVAPYLVSGQAAIAPGTTLDAVQGRLENEAISYVFPEEGALLWGDNFVIPANSSRQYTAELFLNFLLRPEISAQITNQKYYATANEAARAFIDPAILNDPIIFPLNRTLENAEIILPLSSAGQMLYNDIWTRFEAANLPAGD